MDDVKDKVKGFMKKVNNPFSSSSSGKFKGQGRVLGSSSSSSSSSAPSNSNPAPRPIPTQNLNSKPTTSSATNLRPLPQKNTASEQNRTERDRKPGTGFDPFDSLVTSSKRSQNGYSLNVYECPVCGKSFRSEEEVSEHVDSCLSNGDSVERDGGNGVVSELAESGVESNGELELEVCVSTYVSGKPSEGSVDVVLKLLRNVVREPESAKFRKIRMSNPKIKEAVAEVTGGVELLSFVGFELREENGETWAVMEVPSEGQIKLIKKAISLLESQLVQEPPKSENLAPATSAEVQAKAEQKPVDRQVKLILIMLLKGGCGENKFMV